MIKLRAINWGSYRVCARVVLIVLSVLVCGVSRSYAFDANREHTTYGAGAIKCSEYLGMLSNKKKEHLAQLIKSWVLGFISGYNIGADNDKASVVKISSPEQVFDVVKHFCEEKGDYNISDAVEMIIGWIDDRRK